MSILCFAENPGGANGIITLAMENPDIHIYAEGSAIKYIQNHGLNIIAKDSMPNNITALIVGASHSKDSGSFEHIINARKNNIPSFGYIDACVNTEYRFKGHTANSLYYAPDYLFVTEEATSNAYINLGFNPSHIFVVGNPRYDFVVARTSKLIKTIGKEKTILFLADPLIPNIGSDYKKSGFSAQSADDVRSYILLDFLVKYQSDNNIIIKLHPRNNLEEFVAYKDKCTIYQGDELGIDLAFNADLVIGTTTSLLPESAIIGTPTIAVLLAFRERGWLPHILPDNLIISKDQDHLKSTMGNILMKDYERSLPLNKSNLCRNAGVEMLKIIKSLGV